jgi:hypothetical protein
VSNPQVWTFSLATAAACVKSSTMKARIVFPTAPESQICSAHSANSNNRPDGLLPFSTGRRLVIRGGLVLSTFLALSWVLTGCLGPQRRITGRLYDRPTGAPVRNVRLALMRDPGNYANNPIAFIYEPQPVVLRTTVTDSDGRFSFTLHSNRQLYVCPAEKKPFGELDRLDAIIIDNTPNIRKQKGNEGAPSTYWPR